MSATSKAKVKVVRILTLFVSVSLAFFLLYIFAYHIWWILLTAGGLLVAASYFLPKPKQAAPGSGNRMNMPEGKVADDKKAVDDKKVVDKEVVGDKKEMIPETWNEKEISLILGQQPDGNVAMFYVKQLIDRFVYGQSAQTIKSRLEFLEQQNSVVRTYIERQRIAGQYNRVGWEEKAATQKAQSAAARATKEAELENERIEVELEEMRLRKEQAAKKRDDLKKTAAADPKADEEEQKKIRLRQLEERIEMLKTKIRLTKAEPEVDEELRIRKLNALYDELAKAEAEHARML